MESVAVIILSKNNSKILKECLNSFTEKNTYNNIKFYIGDTGSEESVIQEITDYLKSFKYKKELLKFKYYNFSKNHNWIITNRVKEDYILFCNDDIELINDALSIFIKNWEPDLGTIGCKLLFPDNTIQHAGQIHIVNKEKYIWSAGHKLYKQPDRDLDVEYNVGNTFAFCLTKRSVYNSIGGLCEDYIQCFEDVDYNVNCSLNKLKHKFVGHAACYHHESLSRKKNFKNEQEIEDYVRLKIKMQDFYNI